jgi:hypothetical protein
MASGKTAPKKLTTQRDWFLVGTDTPVIRLKTYRGNKGRMVWAVREEGGGFRHVSNSEIELRP